jgi:hypothetical protein
MRASSLCVAFVLFSCGSNDAGTTDGKADGESGGTATPDAGSGGQTNATGGAGVGGGLVDAGKGTGGKAGTGGSPGTGGATGVGGATGKGGVSGTGGATGTGGSTGTGGAAGGTVWYDGEPSGLPFSAGNAGLSSGTANEIATGCHAGSACMSVNLNASGGWAHLGWDPSHNSKQFDLSADATLEFWIKGSSTGIQMEMHGASGGCAWITLNDYLQGGATATWQKVSIPLTAFQMDRTAIHTVDFWLSTGTAAFVIDDARWL